MDIEPTPPYLLQPESEESNNSELEKVRRDNFEMYTCLSCGKDIDMIKAKITKIKDGFVGKPYCSEKCRTAGEL